MKPTELGRPHPPAAKPAVSGRGSSRVAEGRSPAGSRGRAARAWQRRAGDPTPWLLAPRPGAGQGGTRDGTAAPGRRAGGARFLDNRPGAQPFLWAGGGERAQGPPRGDGGGPRGTSRTQPPRPAPRGPRLPCMPAPGHSPRSERTGCRPPWLRLAAGGHRAGTAPGSRPPLRPGPPPRLSPRRPRDPRLRGVDPGPPRSRRPRAPAGLAPHRGTGSGGAGARGCGRPGSRPKVCGDRLGPEEAGPGTCKSAEQGVRTSARARGLGRGRSLPFGGTWICLLGNIILTRLQDREE